MILCAYVVKNYSPPRNSFHVCPNSSPSRTYFDFDSLTLLPTKLTPALETHSSTSFPHQGYLVSLAGRHSSSPLDRLCEQFLYSPLPEQTRQIGYFPLQHTFNIGGGPLNCLLRSTDLAGQTAMAISLPGWHNLVLPDPVH